MDQPILDRLDPQTLENLGKLAQKYGRDWSAASDPMAELLRAIHRIEYTLVVLMIMAVALLWNFAGH